MAEKRCQRCGGYRWTRLHQRSCVPIDFAKIVRRELDGNQFPVALRKRDLVTACMRTAAAAHMSISVVWYQVGVAIEDLRAAGVVVMEGAGKGAKYRLAEVRP